MIGERDTVEQNDYEIAIVSGKECVEEEARTGYRRRESDEKKSHE